MTGGAASAPAGAPEPGDDPEVLSRVAWSLVAEPGDATAGAVVAALGAPAALAWATWAVDAGTDAAVRRLRELLRDGDGNAAGAPVGASAGTAAGDGARAQVGAAAGDGARAQVLAAAGDGASAQVGAAPGVGPGAWARVLARALPRWAPRLAGLEPRRALDALDDVGGTVLVPGRPGWPDRLGDLGPQAPPALWVRGHREAGALLLRSVAVVGARAATPYGQHVAHDLGAGLADGGATVVSGGAFGIDVAAHRGALLAGGPTVALLAGGVDRPSPAGNLDLLERLAASGGALVAESPPGTPPTRARFLQRNRLIAAVSGATVVVEAAWRSGALSTAARAAELLRPVGAVPGPVTSMASTGCHRLLRDGAAVCVTGVDDVRELLGVEGEPAGAGGDEGEGGGGGRGGAGPEGVDLGCGDPTDRADSPASRVLDALPARRSLDVTGIARRAGLGEREVVAALGLLELVGRAERDVGGWRRARAATGAGRRPGAVGR